MVRSPLEKDNVLAQMKQKYSVINIDDVEKLVRQKIEDRIFSERYRLRKENPFGKYYHQIKEAQRSLVQGHHDLSTIQADWENYLQFAHDWEVKIKDEKYFTDKIERIKNELGRSTFEKEEDLQQSLGRNFNVKKGKKNKEQHKFAEQDKKALRSILHKEWQKDLDHEYAKWKLEQIEKYRRQLIDELEDWLKLIQQLHEVLSQLSIDTGFLVDLSKGDISFSDIEKIRQWAQYFQQDDGVRRLCKMLGRIRTAARIKRRELITTTKLVYEDLPDIHSREEIVGIETGNSIEHALVTEKNLLADEDTEMLFYLKFAEKRLMQFEMQGIMKVGKEVQKKEMQEFEEEEKNGPIIICVDSSGSMQGMPETIAKALTLYLATHAAEQERKCYLINFSTSIETLDLSDFSLRELVQFLRRSFHGGTDVTPAIAHALQTMESENYQKADLLVISDFVMGGLRQELSDQIIKARENKNRFYSLAIGNLHLGNVQDVFDNQWVYNPNSGGVQERKLLDMADSIAQS